MNQTSLIFVDGPMGSGKTTTTKLLGAALPDAARIAFPDIKRLIPNYKENEKTIFVAKEVMAVMIDKYLEHSVSVIVEQITKQDGIEHFKKIAEKHNATFFAYRMNAPKDVRWERVQERTREMMATENLSKTKIDELLSYFEPNDTFYEKNPSNLSIEIDTLVNGPAKVVDIIKSNLR